MTRLRFRLWTLMALVATVALVVSAGMMWSRSRTYRARAMFHARMERGYLQMSLQWSEMSRQMADGFTDTVARAADSAKRAEEAEAKAAKVNPAYLAEMFREHARSDRETATEDQRRVEAAVQHSISATCREMAVNEANLVAHHAVLMRKYMTAASNPWRRVAPDPKPHDLP